jgi:hypothetical protein
MKLSQKVKTVLVYLRSYIGSTGKEGRYKYYPYLIYIQFDSFFGNDNVAIFKMFAVMRECTAQEQSVI